MLYLVDLPLVDFLFHGTKTDKAVNKHIFRLAEAIDTKEGLNIVRRIPWRIENYDAVGTDQIRPNPARLCRHQK